MEDNTFEQKSNWTNTTLRKIISSGLISSCNNKRIPLSSTQRSKMQGKYPYYGAASAIDNINDYKYDGFYLLVAEDGTVFDGKSPMLQLVNGKFWVSNHSHVLQGKSPSLTKFLYYLLKNVNVAPYITGAVQPKLTKENLFNISFSIPNNEFEILSITEILSTLDDKITLLKEQNKTIEEIAQAIFREWFVEFNFPDFTGIIVDSDLGKIPEEWETGNFTDVVEIKGGTTPSTKNPNFWNGDIAWTSPKDLSNSEDLFLLKTEKNITQEGLEQIGSGLLPIGTLLLSSRAPIGYLAISEIEISINQGYIAFLPRQYFSNYYMFLWLKLNMPLVISAANGSTFLEISKTSFRNIDTIIPDKNTLEKFEDVVTPLFEKIRFNIHQIYNLSSLRDRLLPKLLGGTIRVKGFEE